MLNKRENRIDGVENRMSWDKREKKEGEQPNVNGICCLLKLLPLLLSLLELLFKVTNDP